LKYIYFGAKWCSPCKQLKPLINSGKYPIIQKDVDGNLAEAQKYKVRSVPTLLWIDDDDTVTKRYVGLTDIKTFLTT